MIRSGDRVFLHTAAATPRRLVEAMTAHAGELSDVEVLSLHTEGPAPYAAPEHAGSFRVNALFVGPNVPPRRLRRRQPAGDDARRGLRQRHRAHPPEPQGVYSGVGGQMDFVRGASLSPGGRPVIALPSVTRRGESRIVPFLHPGAGVVTTRAHVHDVVTEHGIASLYGKNLRQRAAALTEIAHPTTARPWRGRPGSGSGEAEPP